MENKSQTKSSKRKFRFNIIDIILLVVIIAAVGVLVYIFSSGKSNALNSGATRYIEYTVILSEVRDEFKGKVNIGDDVTDTVKLMPIGEVVDIKYEDTLKPVENRKNGTMGYAVMPEHFDMVVTVKATAETSGGFYMIGGYQISVGTLVSMRVPAMCGIGYCSAIREVSE